MILVVNIVYVFYFSLNVGSHPLTQLHLLRLLPQTIASYFLLYKAKKAVVLLHFWRFDVDVSLF